MAQEIEWTDTTGLTEYATLIDATGQWYNTVGAAFETFNAANWTDYDLAGTEFGASGVYTANMPAVAAGVYNLVAWQRLGGAPAITDTKVGTGLIDWSGAVVASSGRSLPVAAPANPNGLLILGINSGPVKLRPGSGVALEILAGDLSAPAVGIAGNTGGDAIQIGFAYGGSDSGGVHFGASDGGAAFSLDGQNSGPDVELVNSIAPTLRAAILTAGAIDSTVAPNLNATISSRAAPGDAMTLTSGERTSIAVAVWGFIVQTSFTAIQVLNGLAAFVMGKTSGGGTNSVVFRDISDNTNAIQMTVDSNGNRSSVTLDI